MRPGAVVVVVVVVVSREIVACAEAADTPARRPSAVATPIENALFIPHLLLIVIRRHEVRGGCGPTHAKLRGSEIGAPASGPTESNVSPITNYISKPRQVALRASQIGNKVSQFTLLIACVLDAQQKGRMNGDKGDGTIV
jgi:hypothetical protein